jgi:flagellar hook-associated protein 3 FlgL
MTFSKTTYNINNKQAELSRLSDMLSTGKRLQDPHDDPSAWSKAMDIKQNIRELTTFGKNMDFATGWGQATESALSQFGDLLIRAKEIGMKSVHQSTAAEQTGNYENMKKITDTAFSLANSQYGNSYIFSGRSTAVAPFDPTSSTPFDYLGDTEPVEVRVGKNSHQTVNLDGQKVFFTDPADEDTNILKTLDDLATAIDDNDTSAIQNQLGKLDTAYEHILSMQSTNGARMADVEQRQNILASIKIDKQSLLADTEEADVAEVITNLQMNKTALEATLQSTSLLRGLNLTNYL